LNQLATGGLVPDRVILLDLEVEDGLRRVLKNRPPDRLEGEKAVFFRRVRQGYLEQASRWPEIFRVVRADAPEQEVHRRVLTALGME
jgi:dTMP kinase